MFQKLEVKLLITAILGAFVLATYIYICSLKSDNESLKKDNVVIADANKTLDKTVKIDTVVEKTTDDAIISVKKDTEVIKNTHESIASQVMSDIKKSRAAAKANSGINIGIALPKSNAEADKESSIIINGIWKGYCKFMITNPTCIMIKE